MMQSLYILRCALRGSLLPMHLEHRQAARSVVRNKRVCNVKPLRFRDTALAALLRCLLQLRCCTPLPLCNTLFQRLTLLSDTSLAQSACKAEPSRSVLHCEQEIYYHRLLSHIAVHSHYSPVGSSGFVANGTRRLTFFATPSSADNGTAVRAVIGRVRNRRLC